VDVQRLVEGFHQLRDIVFPALVGQFDGVAPGQGLEVLGQVVATRHLGAFHQHRDHPHVLAGEGGGDFQAGVVVGVVQAAPPGAVRQVRPARPDHRQQHAAGLQGASLSDLKNRSEKMDRSAIFAADFL
jgi:hypothetical protein